jgi:Zn-dependent protease with chaperone function
LREFIVQTLLHASIAAVAIECLLRVWRLRDPGERLRYRLLTLTLPLVLTPLFEFLAPARLDPEFADSRAIFATAHWDVLRLGPVSLVSVTAGIAGALGLVLFVRDVAPVLRDGRGAKPARERGTPPPEIVREVGDLAAIMGLEPVPPIRWISAPGPVLLASGLRRPVLVVSAGALTRLAPGEQRAALAHELAHVAGFDLLLGWAVMVVRAALVLYPVAQVVARAAIQEMERRADDCAASVTGAPEALARGMAALTVHGDRPPAPRPRPTVGPFNEFLADLASKGRMAALESRRRRLLAWGAPSRPPLSRTRFVLTAMSLSVLLFFVV